MARIVSVHSFRGGTGKSNMVANLAAVLAGQGQRVGLIDTDIQSPGLHVLFGLRGEDLTTSLNDYLWRGCRIQDIAQDMTPRLESQIPGKVFLVPSSTKPGQIAQALRGGYDTERLSRGLRQLITEFSLDTLIIDTHPGLNEETLLSFVISQLLVILMRPDQQDYEGTGITVKVAQELGVPRMMLIVNKSPALFDPASVKANAEQAYACPVVAVLPHSEEMMQLGSAGIFCLRYPDHPLTAQYRQIAAALLG